MKGARFMERINNNNIIAYTVSKKGNNGMYLSVQDGEVIVNAPWYATRNQIQKIVEEKKQWILNKIYEYNRINSYKKVSEIKLLGKTYDMKFLFENIEVPEISFKDRSVLVKLPNSYKNTEINSMIDIIIKKIYVQVIEKLAEEIMEKTRIKMGVAPDNFEIKKVRKDVLASCKNNIITLNPDIAKLDNNTIEFIIVHEFCHLISKTHSNVFYRTLKKYIPNYTKYEKELEGYKY